MSRERPTAVPPAVPDQKDFQRAAAKLDVIDARKERQRAQLEHLKTFSGPGFMGWLGATFSKGKLKRGPQFIRRGYEGSIVDELNDFYTARPRPWRPGSRSSCGPTRKERLKAQRRNTWALNTYGKTWSELLSEASNYLRGSRSAHA